mgnify:CR=1 FL=1
MTTISEGIESFLGSVTLARSKNTFETYKYALGAYKFMLADRGIDADVESVDNLSEDSIAWFAAILKDNAPATEQLYLQATMSFFEFLAAERLASPNLPRLRLLIRQRSRKAGKRLPQFPREDIEKILSVVDGVTLPQQGEISPKDKENYQEALRLYRDRAFLFTLADTGLRVHEACKLRRGDIDWAEGRAIIIGKGNKQAVVRFSTRSIEKIRQYLAMRSAMDGSSGKSLGSLPIFSRHDKGAGGNLKAITTMSGRNIVSEWVRIAIGELEEGKITPHSFRHYFVTTVLRGSGNLKLAQELARHANIAVTQRYAHLSDDELDKGYYEIFDKKDS